MNQAFEIAGVGLAGQQRALELIANNIANLNTTAFKRSEVRFGELIAQTSDPANVRADLSSATALASVSVSSRLVLEEQGELEHTGRQLNLAIDGQGFIELLGPDGQTLLWRGGALSIREDGLLAAEDGSPLGAMISVPAGATELAIDRNGHVRATAADGVVQDLGQLTLARVDDPSLLVRLDGGFYRLTDEHQIDNMTPGQDGAGAFVHGAIERSNVDLNQEMVRLMLVQRAYAANAQVVQAADQLMALANGLRK